MALWKYFKLEVFWGTCPTIVAIIFDNHNNKTIITIIWFSSALKYLSDSRYKNVMSSNHWGKLELIITYLIATCSRLLREVKKFRELSKTSNLFPRKFLFKAKFLESSKSYILENNSPYGMHPEFWSWGIMKFVRKQHFNNYVQTSKF